MKKIYSLVMISGMLALAACGPSAEEKAAMEKARQDSIERVQKATQDSIETANKAAMDKMKADSTATANMEKARQDSMQAAQKKGMKTAKVAKPTTKTAPATTTGEKKIDIFKRGKK
jgi:hypothetical protein